MKAKRAARRKIPAAIICLLLLVTAPIALLTTLAIVMESSFCAIPKEVSLSPAFIHSLLEGNRPEVDLIKAVNDEVSQSLAWHGSVDSGGYYDFEYHCQLDSCDIKWASIWTGVNQYPLCTYERRVRGSLAVVDIDYMERRVRSDVSLWGQILGPGPRWDDISSDIASIKQYALNSIDDDVWQIHPSLVLSIGNVPDGWIISIRTHAGKRIHWEDVDDSAYQTAKEE